MIAKNKMENSNNKTADVSVMQSAKISKAEYFARKEFQKLHPEDNDILTPEQEAYGEEHYSVKQLAEDEFDKACEEYETENEPEFDPNKMAKEIEREAEEKTILCNDIKSRFSSGVKAISPAVREMVKGD